MKARPFPPDIASRFEVAAEAEAVSVRCWQVEQLDRDALARSAGRRLSELLQQIDGRNPFYTRKLDEAGVDVDALRFPDDLGRLPLTTKAELDRRSGGESALGHGAHRAARALHALLPDLVDDRAAAALDRHQRELAVDARVLEGGLSRRARRARATACSSRFRSVRFSASGPASRPGRRSALHCMPGGGMSSQHAAGDDRGGRRRRWSAARRPTRCGWRRSPQHERPSRRCRRARVRMLIVAGEPGGSIPATRERIERSWGARVIDHHGLTEVGPVSFECWEAPGSLHLNEAEYICEVLDPHTRSRGRRRRSRASWSSRISAGRPARSSAIAPATSSSGARSRARAAAPGRGSKAAS